MKIKIAGMANSRFTRVNFILFALLFTAFIKPSFANIVFSGSKAMPGLGLSNFSDTVVFGPEIAIVSPQPQNNPARPILPSPLKPDVLDQYLGILTDSSKTIKERWEAARAIDTELEKVTQLLGDVWIPQEVSDVFFNPDTPQDLRIFIGNAIINQRVSDSRMVPEEMRGLADKARDALSKLAELSIELYTVDQSNAEGSRVFITEFLKESRLSSIYSSIVLSAINILGSKYVDFKTETAERFMEIFPEIQYANIVSEIGKILGAVASCPAVSETMRQDIIASLIQKSTESDNLLVKKSVIDAMGIFVDLTDRGIKDEKFLAFIEESKSKIIEAIVPQLAGASPTLAARASEVLKKMTEISTNSAQLRQKLYDQLKVEAAAKKIRTEDISGQLASILDVRRTTVNFLEISENASSDKEISVDSFTLGDAAKTAFKSGSAVLATALMVIDSDLGLEGAGNVIDNKESYLSGGVDTDKTPIESLNRLTADSMPIYCARTIAPNEYREAADANNKAKDRTGTAEGFTEISVYGQTDKIEMTVNAFLTKEEKSYGAQKGKDSSAEQTEGLNNFMEWISGLNAEEKEVAQEILVTKLDDQPAGTQASYKETRMQSLIKTVLKESLTTEDLNNSAGIQALARTYDMFNKSEKAMLRESLLLNFIKGIEEKEAVITAAPIIMNDPELSPDEREIWAQTFKESAIEIGDNITLIYAGIGSEEFDNIIKNPSVLTAVLELGKALNNGPATIGLVFSGASSLLISSVSVISSISFVQNGNFNLADLLKMIIKSIPPDLKAPLRKDNKNLPSPLAAFGHYLQYGLLAVVFIMLKKRAYMVSLRAIYAATAASVKKEDKPLKILIQIKAPPKNAQLRDRASVSLSRLERRISDRERIVADTARLIPKDKFILDSEELNALSADTDKRLNQLKYWANYLSNMKSTK